MKRFIIVMIVLIFGSIAGFALFNPDYIQSKLKDFYFTVDCPPAVKTKASRKLNDMMNTYIHLTKKTGIKKCKNLDEILENDNMVKIESTKYFIVDKLTYSYPYLTEKASDLLNIIGKRFHEKLEDTELDNTKFVITSLTRTTETVKNLKKKNGNASKNSAHFHGECVDISYTRFTRSFTKLEQCHISFLKEILASVILELKKEKQCWAVAEKKSTCFHVVAR